MDEEKFKQLLEGFIESDRLLNVQIKDLTDVVKKLSERVEKLEEAPNAE